MKKIYLKLLASAFTLTTLLTSAPINGFSEVSAKSVSSSKGEISVGTKIAIGAGVVGAAIAGVVGFVCAWNVGGGSLSMSADTKDTNANFTNTRQLCYWHAFVQQMYSLKSFRKFINDVDLKTLKSSELAFAPHIGVSEIIKAFRELFDKMDKGERIDTDSSLAFAKRILPGYVIGYEQEIGEIFTSFISDVNDLYKRYYNNKSNIFEQPIRLEHEPLNLHSLLVGEPSYESKRNAVKDLVKREELCKAYNDKFKTDIPEQVDDSVLNNISNDLSDVPCVNEALKKLPAPELDIPVIDDQFAIFVARHDFNLQNLEPVKVTSKVAFGDGNVNYKGKMFEVTAVSVHHGTAGGGHYYTYKKHGNSWYKYDDSAKDVPCVSWKAVKEDAETNCTMITFSLKK